ncbi:MAG: hypothetical protein BECKG1743D_GA0114223_103616 [Candidatus Kentron sp. G]|nr:MAG: hypothetical protein BECKG1743F_GA0114225_103025 [Candidatus Kentron sp. G]VFN00216.1 MAG: hypothetical protein BECKG1743E_GA0114224_103126 [Candidatus Kentron sp. G]VFN02398.1 MAG: hypothetical protein BECKG1743D_GA0114223_103616 [Candidatus Kentron sp. G]
MEVNEHFEHIFNAVRECEATFAYSSFFRGKCKSRIVSHNEAR